MARSGSSFLGEMLSLSPGTTYVFEPLRKIRWADSALEGWTEEDKARIVPTLDGVYNCDSRYLEPKHISKCATSNAIVVKTIRLRKQKFVQWRYKRASFRPVKVIHLVRDPRARYHSLLQGLKSFSSVLDIFGNSCRWEEEDLLIRRHVPKEDYYLIRYEDLVSDPLVHLERLYSFAGLQFGDREREMVLEHTQRPRRGQEPANQTKMEEYYYSTFRGTQFDPNKWQTDLNLREIREVEGLCSTVMETLGYQVFHPPEGREETMQKAARNVGMELREIIRDEFEDILTFARK